MVLNKLQSGSVNNAKLVCNDKIWRWVTTAGDIGFSPPDTLLSTLYQVDRKKLTFLLSFYTYTNSLELMKNSSGG
jgi:hypothetical protein